MSTTQTDGQAATPATQTAAPGQTAAEKDTAGLDASAIQRALQANPQWLEQVRIKTKADGQDVEITVAEAGKNYARQAAMTKATQEAASLRQEIETLKTARAGEALSGDALAEALANKLRPQTVTDTLDAFDPDADPIGAIRAQNAEIKRLRAALTAEQTQYKEQISKVKKDTEDALAKAQRDAQFEKVMASIKSKHPQFGETTGRGGRLTREVLARLNETPDANPVQVADSVAQEYEDDAIALVKERTEREQSLRKATAQQPSAGGAAVPVFPDEIMNMPDNTKAESEAKVEAMNRHMVTQGWAWTPE